MKKISFTFACLGIVLGLAAATPAHAQIRHSFVSTNGSGSACTFSAPCESFGAAIAATVSGGVVTCVDQGANSDGFSASSFTVDRSVTIDCSGTAAVAAFVTVNGPGIVVTLRNLQINSISAGGGIGIDFQNGAELNIDHCVIDSWNSTGPGDGIHFAPSGPAKLNVTDSVIQNNGTASAGAGINVAPTSSGSARVTLRHVQLDDNFNGLNVDNTATSATTRVIVSDSSMTGNANNGINLATSGPVDMTVERSVISNNLRGIKSLGASATVRIGYSTITGNGAGVQNLGGTMTSYKNNIITGNGQNGTPLAAATDD